MYQLEKYKGTRTRFTCPACGVKAVFARYVNENGDYLDNSVGRCNRESNCGYHKTPKDFLACNTVTLVTPDTRVTKVMNVTPVTDVTPVTKNLTERYDTIENSFVVRSLANTHQNRFINFLLSFIDAGVVESAIRRYFIGSTKDGKTCFWQIDKEGRARTGKIISYLEETGKRDKKINPSWIHYELKRHKLLPPNFEHRLCFFGEHLLKNSNKPVAIVEAEKTAVIASIFIDKFNWLAIGGKSYLKAEKLKSISRRKIVLYPDADGFALWEKEAGEARRIGLDTEVSDFIEKRATNEEKAQGLDLADYLIRSELKAQRYNAKLDSVLNDSEIQKKYLAKINETFGYGIVPSIPQIRQIVNQV